MAATINFTPLSGELSSEPLAFLLEIDGYKILLDCGWDHTFDESALAPLVKVVPDLDCVLLSHPDVLHIGALPYLVGKLGLDAPIYATLPVWRMGQMFLYDAFQDRAKYKFDVFALDDVDTAFDKFTQLKYAQAVTLSGKGEGITLTPFQAGHMVGGTIWQISKETESIVYGVHFNHKRERHLDPGVMETLRRPTVLITDGSNALELLKLIMRTLQGGGNVLMPVDTAGRSLEALLLLNQHWQHYNHVAFNTADFAKSLLEWMSAQCMKQFDSARDNPFTLKNVQFCHSLEDLHRLPPPYVALCTNFSLDDGFAKEVFLELADNPANLVLFTQRCPADALASKLQAMKLPSMCGGCDKTLLTRCRLDVPVKRVIQLQGEELEAHLKEKQLQEEQMQLERKDEALDSDSEDESGELLRTGTVARRQFRLTPAFPMFPFHEVKRVGDAYGVSIDTNAFRVKAETAAVDERAAPMDIEQEKEKDITPSKTVEEMRRVHVKCKVHFIDLEGRSDGKSIQTILKHMSPHRIVLIHGEEAAKSALKSFCVANSVCSEVYCPSKNQLLELTSEASVYRVNLQDTLLKTVHFVKVGDYDVGFLHGQIKIDYAQSTIPIMQPPPPVVQRERTAVFLGDAKLARLKTLLNERGMRAEFFGGVLLVNGGVVTVRKAGLTELSIQGALGPDYFLVRELVYSQYEVI